MQYFPNGCCGNVTSLLRFYLKNNYGIDTKEYWYDVEPDGSHAFLKYHDWIIDLTGKQQQFDDYDRPLVYVDNEDDFYNSMIYRDEYPYYDFFQMKEEDTFTEMHTIYVHDYFEIIDKLK